MRAEAAGLRADISERVASAEQERAEWIADARAAAVGRAFKTLGGAGGRSFEEVVITRVTDIGVEFRHAAGTARIAAKDLSSGLQQELGLDLDVSGLAQQQERAEEMAYASAVDRGVASNEADRAEAQREAARQQNERAVALANIRASQSRSSASSLQGSSALRQSARPFGSNTWHWSYDSSYYRRSQYYTPYVYYYSSSTPSYRTYSSPATSSGSCSSGSTSRSSSFSPVRSNTNVFK